jgi:O-methyltransferase
VTLTSRLRAGLQRIGLLEPAWKLREWLAPMRSAGAMRFPTFDPLIQRAAIGSGDYARYASLGLAIRRIEADGISGAFAEAGVYQGATSRFILRCAPGRTFYLFDTFEGFPAADREPSPAADLRFRDTSEDDVRRMLGNPTNVVIRKGRFPETAAGLEQERFALAVLDFDLFNPTLAGLEFFYPRLARGGYVFVHDFNSPESNSACRRAVTQFMAGRPEQFVELPDRWGSVVIRKS